MINFLFLTLAFIKTDKELMVTTQVAMLEHGKINMPSDTDGIVIEIGCSDRNTADDEILPKYPKGFLISFEPLLDKYAVLLARGTERYHKHLKDKAVPLGHHHNRGVVIPMAVSPTGGQLSFHVSKVAGCSSLLEINRNTRWGRSCLNQLENRTVDSMKIEDLISLLPDKMPIHYMKFDMQGLDGTIITKLPQDFLARVQTIQFESVNPVCNALYEGQMQCPYIAEFLNKNGFEGKCRPGCEPTSTFFKT